MAFPSEDTYSLVCSGINETGLLVLRMIDRDLRHPQNACSQLIDLETPPSEEWYCVPEIFLSLSLPSDVSCVGSHLGGTGMTEQVLGSAGTWFLRAQGMIFQ